MFLLLKKKLLPEKPTQNKFIENKNFFSSKDLEIEEKKLNLSFGYDNEIENKEDVEEDMDMDNNLELDQSDQINRGGGFSFCDNLSPDNNSDDMNSDSHIFQKKENETLNPFGGISNKSSARIFAECDNEHNMNFLNVFSQKNDNAFIPIYEDQSNLNSDNKI